MPEIKNATGILSQIARPVDDISLVCAQSLDKRQVIKRIIFGVGILNTHIISPDRKEAGAQGRPFPFILFMPHSDNFVML